MLPGRLVEGCHIVPLAVPIDTTGAAVAGDWVSMKKYRKACIIIMQGAWAGGTPAVSLDQGTSAAGADSKTLGLTEYWQGTALTDDVLARTAVESDTFNLPATANTFTVLEIDVSDLDKDNGFAYFNLDIASPGANADLISAVAILYDGDEISDPINHSSQIA